MKTRSLLRAPLLGLLVASVALAGCMGVGENGEEKAGENEAPEAKLDTNRKTGWNDDQFTFNGRNSRDSDGRIETWKFDFGDGSQTEVTREEDAEVTHRYLEGGEYLVTLTVTDDGGPNAGALTDTESLSIAVNEEQPVAGQVIYASPTNASQPSKFRHAFDVTDDADSVEATLNFRSTVPLGSTELKVRILDPEDDILEEKTLSVAAGTSKSLDISSELFDAGTHNLEIEVESGGATMDGRLKIYYDEGMTPT